MSLDRNKRDFETVISDLDELTNELDGVLDQDILDVLKGVVSEYEIHLKGDIENLVDDYEELKDKLEDP